MPAVYKNPKPLQETLRKFRNREVNLLVAWSALQDGVDLPRCNLVIKFDLPDDYRAYVYAKVSALSRSNLVFNMIFFHEIGHSA